MHPLYPYFYTICGSSKCLYNVTDYYIRNIMTGIQKDISKRTPNEQAVIEAVEQALPAYERTRLKTLKKRIDKIKKDDSLSLAEKQQKIDKLKDDYKPASLPTADKWFLSYNMLDAVFKYHNNPDYLSVPSHVNQQTMKDCYEAWKSYFKSVKDWTQHPEKYLGKPKLPKYKKNPLHTATFTNVVCKFKQIGNKVYLQFPKTKLLFDLGNSVLETDKLAEVKIQPYYGRFLILVSIKEPDVEFPKLEPTRICAIDLGVKNFAAITNNIGLPNLLFKGKVLCYENHHYEKEMAHIKSKQTKGTTNGFKQTNASNALCRHRLNLIDNYMHKVAKRIINWCLSNQIDTIVIGSNKHWKQKSRMNRMNNQPFADIPFDKFKRIIQYQCVRNGLNCIFAEESYTSQASFLDDDDIPAYDKNNYQKYVFSGHRYQKKYVSKDGTVINADLNGSANTLRKAIPTAFDNGIKPDFTNTLIYKHPDMKPYRCAA